MFSIDTYNNLPSIRAADAAFHEQLSSSGLTVDTLLAELAPLFCADADAGSYGVWLLHHHFDLTVGERMVGKGDITEPTTDTSSHIVAERWSEEGEELEHRYIDNIDDVPPPPSTKFLKRFKDIMDARKIDTLGVCYAPNGREMERIQDGRVFLESTNQGHRKHVIEVVPADDSSLKGEVIFGTSWVPMSGDVDYRIVNSCTHVCWDGNHGMGDQV